MPQASATERARILIVDDHPTFCEGLSAIFQRADDFEVAGIALNSGDALSAARNVQPDIIMLDITLSNDQDSPQMNGLDLVHQLRCICPDAKIAVLTGNTGREYLMTAMRLGVEGYLEKVLPAPALLTAIRQIRDGQRVIGSPDHLTMALTELHEIVQERARKDTGLTEPELEMLRLAAAGCNNKAIGTQMFWSEITVKRKMQAVYHKLGVSSRAQAVAEVIRRGFV